MKNEIPQAGQFYRHFKNKYYQILCLAKYSEDKSDMVVYQALYDDFGIYVRPLEMFISEVDHEKYPDVKQVFRFERVTIEEVKKVYGNVTTPLNPVAYPKETKENEIKESEVKEKKNPVKALFDRIGSDEKKDFVEDSKGIENVVEDEEKPSPVLMGFLDLDTTTEKLKYLQEHRTELNDDIINACAASMDFTVDDGPIDERYLSLRNCLQMRSKYEINRFRP